MNRFTVSILRGKGASDPHGWGDEVDRGVGPAAGADSVVIGAGAEAAVLALAGGLIGGKEPGAGGRGGTGVRPGSDLAFVAPEREFLSLLRPKRGRSLVPEAP